MKIIVFSDSHGAVFPMRRAAETHAGADLFLHLGDGCREFERLCADMGLNGQAVRGNCDIGAADTPVTRILEAGGCRIFMTHGHEFGVKYTLTDLIAAGKREGAGLILFGHTHIAFCGYEEGIHLLNPGSIGMADSFGVVQIGRRILGEGGKTRPEILISTAKIR